MTSSKSASRRRRRDREPRTEPIQQLPAPIYDATAIEFTGVSAAGLPDGGIDYDTSYDADGWYTETRTAPPAGYTATTGPMPALGGRPGILIGDALALDPEWAPKFANLPCGHCGAALDITPAGVLDRARVIGHLNWLAANAGWKYDVDLTWTCPHCQQHDAWKARQGQLEVRWPAGARAYCFRHDASEPDASCTCPGAVLAVDVMLASEDHLGSGRRRHKAGTG